MASPQIISCYFTALVCYCALIPTESLDFGGSIIYRGSMISEPGNCGFQDSVDKAMAAGMVQPLAHRWSPVQGSFSQLPSLQHGLLQLLLPQARPVWWNAFQLSIHIGTVQNCHSRQLIASVASLALRFKPEQCKPLSKMPLAATCAKRGISRI